MKRPRRHDKDEKKGNHFGGSKAPRSPVSVGEEYILTIEQMGKEGVGVAKLRGVSILINNTNPGDKVMVRITKVGRTYAVAEVFSQKQRSQNFPVSGLIHLGQIFGINQIAGRQTCSQISHLKASIVILIIALTN